MTDPQLIKEFEQAEEQYIRNEIDLEQFWPVIKWRYPDPATSRAAFRFLCDSDHQRRRKERRRAYGEKETLIQSRRDTMAVLKKTLKD
jgi:hypothetical protein